MEDKLVLELWVSPEEFERWERASGKFFMNVYEFIRKSTSMEATLLIEQFDWDENK